MAKTSQEGITSISPEVMAGYEPVIGLEVHVQLKTLTKAFLRMLDSLRQSAKFEHLPRLPWPAGRLAGSEQACGGARHLRAALALHLNVQDFSRLARKNYFYPDLPKGYQISMYELPLATAGYLEIEHDGQIKRIGITRLHLEDDAAKNLHEGFPDSLEKSYVDYNRAAARLSPKLYPSLTCAHRPRTHAYLTACLKK